MAGLEVWKNWRIYIKSGEFAAEIKCVGCRKQASRIDLRGQPPNCLDAAGQLPTSTLEYAHPTTARNQDGCGRCNISSRSMRK